MTRQGPEWVNTDVQGEDNFLVAADEAATSIEARELPRSEGPKGYAAAIMGKEFRRRDPSSSRHREGRIFCLTLGTGLLMVEDGDDNPSS